MVSLHCFFTHFCLLAYIITFNDLNFAFYDFHDVFMESGVFTGSDQAILLKSYRLPSTIACLDSLQPHFGHQKPGMVVNQVPDPTGNEMPARPRHA